MPWEMLGLTGEDPGLWRHQATAPRWDLIKAFSSLGKGAAVLGRAPRRWQHPCVGRGWVRAENISPPQPGPAASCCGRDGDQFGQTQVSLPCCALSVSPRELRPNLGDTEKDPVPLGPVDGPKDQAGGSRLSLTAEERIWSWSLRWESQAGLLVPLCRSPSPLPRFPCHLVFRQSWKTGRPP